MPPLLSIDDALARVLARARPLAAEPVPVAVAAGRVLAEDGGGSRRSAVVRELGDGRLRRSRRRCAGSPADCLQDRCRPARGTGRWRRVRRWRSRRAACRRCRYGRSDRGCCRNGQQRRDRRPRCSGRACATDRWGCSRRRRSTRSRHGARGRADRCAGSSGVAEAACAAAVRRRPQHRNELRAPGDELGPGRMTSRTGRCWRRRSRPPGRSSSGSVRSPTTRTRIAPRSCADSRTVPSARAVYRVLVSQDLVRRILTELGVEEDFWGVAVRPGKPLAFGSRGATLVFGLPGNPVSALVAVECLCGLHCWRCRGRRGQARTTAPVGSRRCCGGTRRETTSSAPARGTMRARPCSSRSAARSLR